MASMNVREMHKRLMLYKMVQEVMKKAKRSIIGKKAVLHLGCVMYIAAKMS
ncbi:MAG: hypothetical protein ACOYJ1_17110 [Peptococcales bacterium]|jgi:hypothetical protein